MADAAAEAAAEELLQISSKSAANSIYGSLANFDIDRKIGKGQFSVVYRATSKIDARPVALKKVQVRHFPGFQTLLNEN